VPPETVGAAGVCDAGADADADTETLVVGAAPEAEAGTLTVGAPPLGDALCEADPHALALTVATDGVAVALALGDAAPRQKRTRAPWPEEMDWRWRSRRAG